MRLPYRRNSIVRNGFDQEMILEAGMLIFAAGLATGIGVLLLGRTNGQARHAFGRQEGAPAGAGMPHQQNQNVSTVAAR